MNTELTPILSNRGTEDKTEVHPKETKNLGQPVLIKVNPSKSVEEQNNTENLTERMASPIWNIKEDLEEISSNKTSDFIKRIFEEKTSQNPNSPNQRIIYIEKPCECSQKGLKNSLNSSNVSSSGTGMHSKGIFSPFAITKGDMRTSNEQIVIVDSLKSQKIYLPDLGDYKEDTKEAFVGKGVTKHHMARSITIKSLYNDTNHEIYTVGDQKIGNHNSYRLMGGKCVTFYGVGNTWYPV